MNLWIEDANNLVELIANDLHGHQQIGVAADDDGTVEAVEMRECAQIGGLPRRCVGIVGTRVQFGGEVFDADDLMVRLQMQFHEPLEIEPAMRRPADCAEVEIESIHIRDGSHEDLLAQKQGPALLRRPKTASPKLQRGLMKNEVYGLVVEQVKRPRDHW